LLLRATNYWIFDDPMCCLLLNRKAGRDKMGTLTVQNKINKKM
jgi:hypothetical protein